MSGIILGAVLLTLVYLIPQYMIHDNIHSSVTVLKNEMYIPILRDINTYAYDNEDDINSQFIPAGLARPMLQGIDASKLDNMTDGFMYNISYIQNGNALKDAILGEYIISEGGENDPVTWLYDYMYGVEREYRYSDYARYWHGYQIFLRPLSVVMNISSIRFLNMSMQLSAVIFLLALLVKKNKSNLIIPFFVMWVFLVPVTLFYSLQYSTAFYVTLLTCIFVVSKFDMWDTRKMCLLFEIAGILLAYFDFLTYPMVCFGVPAILYFSLDSDRYLGVRDRLKEFIVFGFSWSFGYAGMWSGKWLLAAMFTEKDVLGSVKNSIKIRSSADIEGMSVKLMDVLQKNLNVYKSNVFILIFVLALVLCVLFYFKYKHKKLNYSVVALLLLCCILPFAWYMMMRNHSFVHARFTFREYAVLFYALISIPYISLDFSQPQLSAKLLLRRNQHE